MSAQENIKKQKFLGKNGLIVFITLMNMFIPLSTDLYLPALPTMSTYFGVSSCADQSNPSQLFLLLCSGYPVLGAYER